MNLYVVRHGQTNWNKQNRLQGESDVKLNQEGISQAIKLGKKLEEVKFDLIITSPLQRAIETAKFINKNQNKPIVIEKNFKERNYGKIEGKTSPNLQKFWDYLQNSNEKEVEPVQEFVQRVQRCLEKVLKENAGKDILLVTHHGVMIAIDCYFNGFKKNYDFSNYHFDNGSYEKYNLSKKN